MIAIRKIKNNRELLTCLDITKDAFEKYHYKCLPIVPSLCRKEMMQLPHKATYFRVVEHGGRVVGWMQADLTQLCTYSPKKVLSQRFYHTSLKGISAVKALLAVHRDMFEFAERRKIEVLSTGSYLPNKEVYQRILIKDGWVLDGGLMFKITKYWRP